MRLVVGMVVAVLCAAGFYFIVMAVLSDGGGNGAGFDRGAYRAINGNRLTNPAMRDGVTTGEIVSAHIRELGLDEARVVPETVLRDDDHAVVRFELVYPGEAGADDSVRGTRRALEFARDADGWHLIWAGEQWRCWPGRGHEDWGTEPCR